MFFDTFEWVLHLNTVSGALKSAGSGEKLLEGFQAAPQNDPVIVIAIRTADVEGEGFGGTRDHGHFLISCYARGERECARDKRLVAGELIPSWWPVT
ncbi:MAG: hypothetical protein DMG34_14225 [Acidobacteria bacterium]|nr:MAG: hypothetical protein DMG34_14225 [Acidobacteriota bacterium]